MQEISPAVMPPSDPWRLTVHQPADGYRFALDAFLLADFVPTTAQSPILDLGTGCGVVTLLLARRLPHAHLLGIELQHRLVTAARQNIVANDLQQRVGVVQGDMRSVASLLPQEAFGTVVCNPPYRVVGQGRLNPHPEKAMARHEVAVTLAQVVQAAKHALCRRGRCVLIYHPSRLAELCTRLAAACLQPRRLRLVHATAETPATMVLIEAIGAGRDALTVLPPLYVYDAYGTYSTEMQAIFRGRDLAMARS